MNDVGALVSRMKRGRKWAAGLGDGRGEYQKCQNAEEN